jgi:hypothetical protein
MKEYRVNIRRTGEGSYIFRIYQVQLNGGYKHIDAEAGDSWDIFNMIQGAYDGIMLPENTEVLGYYSTEEFWSRFTAIQQAFVKKCRLCGKLLQTNFVSMDGSVEACPTGHYIECHNYGGTTITVNGEDFFLDESGYGNVAIRTKIDKAINMHTTLP